MFTGHDLPDDGLVRACLDSYRSLASTPERLVTGDDLLRRSQEHTELLATLADGRPSARACGSGSAGASRRGGTAAGVLGDLLDAGEQRVYLGGIGPAAEELAEVDGIWYVRGKAAFLFEVEWTAMLGEPLLRRHARIPPDDGARPVPRHRPGADRARPLQARALAAAAGGPRRGQLAHRQVRPPARVPRARPARPGRPRAVPRPRPGGRARRRADAAVRRLTAGAHRQRDAALG